MAVKDILRQKRVHNPSCVYEIIKSTGKRLIKPNLVEAEKFLNIGFNSLNRRLDIESQVNRL
jgi:hypothetical protein